MPSAHTLDVASKLKTAVWQHEMKIESNSSQLALRSEGEQAIEEL